MKILTLSDHTGEQLKASTARREAGNADAVRDFQRRLIQRDNERNEVRQALGAAWQERRLLATLGSALRWILLALTPGPARPALQQTSRDESVWASGREGEQAVARRLAGRLGDEWTLLTGYKNRKGEIDGVLVGPGGVFAIEIKFINGVVYCEGDRWWRDKFDRYSNLVESMVPIADKSGRGPSRQVNESADILQAFLTTRTGLDRIGRAVIFAHEASRIGELRRPTVDCIATLQTPDFVHYFECEGTVLTGDQVVRIVQAIQKDHEFHSRPRTLARLPDAIDGQMASSQEFLVGQAISPSHEAPAIQHTHADGRIEPEVWL